MDAKERPWPGCPTTLALPKSTTIAGGNVIVGAATGRTAEPTPANASGLPNSSLAAIVTRAGLPDVPPIARPLDDVIGRQIAAGVHSRRARAIDAADLLVDARDDDARVRAVVGDVDAIAPLASAETAPASSSASRWRQSP